MVQRVALKWFCVDITASYMQQCFALADSEDIKTFELQYIILTYIRYSCGPHWLLNSSIMKKSVAWTFQESTDMSKRKDI